MWDTELVQVNFTAGGTTLSYVDKETGEIFDCPRADAVMP